MKEPRLSIVTISYNQGVYLEECIRSVVDQGVSGLEYIVVDPGSTDNSRAVISRYSHRISRAVLERDEGPADGLNKGFALATGDVFGYINADDRFVPGALNFVKDFFAKHEEVDVLCGGIRIVDEAGRPSLRARAADRFDLARYAAGICTVGQQATFFRRSAFLAAGRFNVVNRTCWDGELLVDMALQGARFATARKILGDFRVYGNSLTGGGIFKSERYLNDHKRINDKIAESGIELYSPLKKKLSRFAYRANLGRHLGYLLAR